MVRIVKITGQEFGGEQYAFPECPFAGREAHLSRTEIDVICMHPKKTCMTYCGSYNLHNECPYDVERRKDVLEG